MPDALRCRTCPDGLRRHPEALEAALAALHDAHHATLGAADAALTSADPGRLRRCIALCLDGADLCAATLAVLSRSAGADPRLWRSVVATSIEACRLCARACRPHVGRHPAFGAAVRACRRAELACDDLLGALPA